MGQVKKRKTRKEIARGRVRGLLIFLIVTLSLVLFYDIYLLISGWF